MTDDFVGLATDIDQYGKGNTALNWKVDGDVDHHSRILLRQYLIEILKQISDKERAVDVGCGQGWLLQVLRRLGWQSVFGFDPSQQNVDVARRKVPWVTIECAALKQLSGMPQYANRFDVVTAVMVFEHLPSAQQGFLQLKKLLKPGGTMVVIFGDFDVMLSARRGTAEVTRGREISPGEVAIKTDYGKDRLGTLYDIARHHRVMLRAASDAGLRRVFYTPITIPPWVVEHDATYESEVDKPYYHMMVLQ